MQIKKKLITSNNKGELNANKPQYIVIHDTGNTRKGAGANNHYQWLQNTPNTNASAHVFVDDHEALQVIEYTTPAWHTGKLYVAHPQVPTCNNYNSIGVEFCVNIDGDLTKTLSNTVSVVQQLMALFHIPIEKVITHRMSAGKPCPMTFIQTPQLYEKFYAELRTMTTADKALNEAIKYLVAEDIMNTPSYWLVQAREVKYLRDLIINMYLKLKAIHERE